MLQRSETVDEVFVAFGFKRGGYGQKLDARLFSKRDFGPHRVT